MVTRLSPVLGIGCGKESDVCVFGKRIYRQARTKIINDEGSVSSVLGRPLCHGSGDVPNSCVFPTSLGNSEPTRERCTNVFGACEDNLFQLPQLMPDLCVVCRCQVCLKGHILILCCHRWSYGVQNTCVWLSAPFSDDIDWKVKLGWSEMRQRIGDTDKSFQSQILLFEQLLRLR